MGIYLLTIATHSEINSERYNRKNEIEWRTSLRCSIIGSLVVISSQASCFLMVILTSFRLYNICNPMALLTSPALTWKIGLCTAWLMAVLIAVMPIAFRSINQSIFWTRLSLGGRGGSSSSWSLQASRSSATKDRCSAGMPRRDQLRSST